MAYEVIESTRKSHNARVIDLDRETVDLLRALHQQQQDERAEWGTDYENRDLVAAREDGSAIHPHSFSQMFGQIVKRAGLRTIRLHDLRHYADGGVMRPPGLFSLVMALPVGILSA